MTLALKVNDSSKKMVSIMKFMVDRKSKEIWKEIRRFVVESLFFENGLPEN